MPDRYRITWEMPNVFNLKDPNWNTTTRETEDPWDQYHTLLKWSRTGEEPIRNVKLEKATINWTELVDEE